MRLNRAEQALECYNRCVSLRPEFAEAWINKGAVVGELGRHREALDCFMEAKRLVHKPIAQSLFAGGT